MHIVGSSRGKARVRLVHIVDDEEAIRRSCGFLLARSGYTVHSWSNGEAFLAGIDDAGLSCVLLDFRMPTLNGLEVQAELAARGNPAPVILMTGHGDVSVAVRAMKAGAIDFLAKPFERKALLGALEAAFDCLEDTGLRRAGAAASRARMALLTPREQEVLGHLADGLPNQSIADCLLCSLGTIETLRAKALSKLGVQHVLDALRIYFAANMCLN